MRQFCHIVTVLSVLIVGIALFPFRVGSIAAQVSSAEKPPDFAGVIHTPKLNPVKGKRKMLAVLWDPHRSDYFAGWTVRRAGSS